MIDVGSSQRQSAASGGNATDNFKKMDLTGYGYRCSRRTSARDVNSQSATPGASADNIGESTVELSGDAIRLMASLERKLRLEEVARRYPRVLNRIASVWKKPSEADRCFDELLMNFRGTRQGFPQTVLNELASLRHYHATCVFPKRVDPWDQALLR